MSRQTGDMDAVRHMVSHVILFLALRISLYFLMALVMIFSVKC